MSTAPLPAPARQSQQQNRGKQVHGKASHNLKDATQRIVDAEPPLGKAAQLHEYI